MTLQSTAAAPSFTSPPPNAQFNDMHEPIQSHFHPILFQQTTTTTTMMMMMMTTTMIIAPLFIAFAAMIHRRRTPPLPPGSVGPLPLVGETLRLIAAYKTENPEPFIDDRVRRHGRVFTSHVFGERTVFSADPEFNRLVLSGEGRGGSLRCSYPSSIATLLGPHSLLLTPVGPHHRRMHALVLASFASTAALRGSPELLGDVDAMVRRTVGGWGEGEVVRLLEQAKKFTFELTVKQLMSEDPGEWTEGLRREYLLVIDGFFSVPFPSFIPFTTYNRSIKARKKVAEALRGMVRRRKDEDPTAERIRRRKDMVSELLEADVSEEEMVDFLVALLVAGYETTSTIITLAVKFLTDAPPALQLLQKEHEEIKARKEETETLDWSDYKAMPFTQCVINETLRVANVISGVFRRAETDIHFKGYTIPKGCKVFASFRAVHLDPDHYKDARTFNPWRWQEMDAPQQNAGRGGGIFTPFGGGPRLCPGYELARVEISFFLHYLVTRFCWDVAEEDRLVFFPTTRTLKGYPIRVRSRRHCTAL